MDMPDKLDFFFKNDVSPKLNSVSITKLRNYSEYDAQSLNKYLLSHGQSSGIYDSSIELIRNSIKLSRIPFPLTVYHGTSSQILKGHTFDDYREKSINVKTLLSCSIDKDTAGIFMPLSNPFLNCIMLEINLPANYPALWMKKLSLHPNENELLLLNNTKLDIFSFVEEKMDTNYYTLLKTVPHIK